MKSRIGVITYTIFGFFVVFRFGENYSLQPGHMVMVATLTYALFVLASGRSAALSNFSIIVTFLLFLFAIVDLFWVLRLGDGWIYPLYWIMVSMYFLVLSTATKRIELEALVRGITIAYAMSVLVAMYQFYTILETGEFSRPTGLSGTPNHLALQGILLLCIHASVYARTPLGSFLNLMVLMGVLLSLSRSGIIAILIFHTLRIFSDKISALIVGAMVFLVVVVMVNSTFSEFGASSGIVNSILDRLAFTSQDLSVTERGVSRVIYYPQALIYGASDFRASYPLDDFQGLIHNNFLQLVFAFGVVGMLFSLIFLGRLFLVAGFSHAVTVVVFSTSHFFFQNVMFLILLGILVGLEGAKKSMSSTITTMS